MDLPDATPAAPRSGSSETARGAASDAAGRRPATGGRAEPRPGQVTRPDVDASGRSRRRGRSSTCRIASATVSGSIQAPASYVPALLLVHLLLHRGRGAAGVDGGDPHAVLLLLGAQRVGQRAQPVLRGGVRRPVRRRRRRPAPEFTKTTVPRAARSAGRATRVSTAGATRLTSSCSLPGVGRSSATGPRSTTPAAWTTESSRSGSSVGQRLDRVGVGQVGDERSRARAALGRRSSRALGRARQQDQLVAALEQPVGERPRRCRSRRR